jgi:precorrin-2 dehydrogenase/sirohydrochlorin ferrochelatase
MSMEKLYPLTLRLRDKKVLVVGAGQVALRKLQGLMGTGADITVVSPEVLPEIQALPEITIIQRPFLPADVEGAHIIYAATDQPAVNAAVGQCIQPWQWFNDTALAEASSFYTPAVLRQGGVVIAVSTQARDPRKAKRVRDKLKTVLYEGLDE